MRFRKGSYHDALFVKKNRVTLILCESTGAVSPRSLAYLSYLSRRARGQGARDGTRYGTSRLSPRSYYVHHTQRLSMAAAAGDVKGLHECARIMKQRLHGAASLATAA